MVQKKKIVNNNRRLREEPYISFKHNKENNKNQLTPKPRRVVKSRCNHKLLQPKSKNSFLCAMFSEGDRLKLFKDFWKIKS